MRKKRNTLEIIVFWNKTDFLLFPQIILETERDITLETFFWERIKQFKTAVQFHYNRTFKRLSQKTFQTQKIEKLRSWEKHLSFCLHYNDPKYVKRSVLSFGIKYTTELIMLPC